MNTLFGERIKNLRKSKGLSQDKLAEAFGLSVQAVSKWECSQSYPDIELLPAIADFFGVSVDYLLRDNGQNAPREQSFAFPEDGVLRIVQFKGSKMIRKDVFDPKVKIPLAIDEAVCQGTGSPAVAVEIWGSADIEGNISGGANAGGEINCGNVSGGANAGGEINCGNISGGVSAGGGISCGNVYGGVNAGGEINCGDIDGNIFSCDGDIHCMTIKGDASCAGNIYYKEDK